VAAQRAQTTFVVNWKLGRRTRLTSSLSGEVLSPENIDFSQDEAYSDEDSDHYEDFSSGESKQIGVCRRVMSNGFHRFRFGS
jgi:hypothetical protein